LSTNGDELTAPPVFVTHTGNPAVEFASGKGPAIFAANADVANAAPDAKIKTTNSNLPANGKYLSFFNMVKLSNRDQPLLNQ